MFMKRYIAVNNILTHANFAVNRISFRKRYRKLDFRKLHNYSFVFCCKMTNPISMNSSFFSSRSLL